MVTKIVELYQEELHFYSGNYEYYEQEKELRLDMQQKAYSNQQDYIRQNERLVERFRAKASKAAMAQSLIKKLDKLDRIEEPNLERPNIKINFRIDKRPGKSIVKIKHASKSFGDIKILENAEAEIIREEKIALIGANGKGKSTVLRMLAGTEPFEGEKSGGHNVDQSFYAQHQLEALNSEHTIMQEMMTCGSQKTEQELRTLLGCFLFSGDDVSKKIKILSGGEKARVALAKTIISRANFLLLDEPTNHLDIHSVELMIEALNRYEGSYILVSHDRYFISKTANKIWEIVNYKIKEFAGGYDEYAEWKERKSSSESGVQNREFRVQSSEFRVRNTKSEKPKKTGKETTVLNVKPLHQPHKENSIDKEQKKEIQKQQKLFQQLEEKIAALNKLKAEHEAALSDTATYSEKEKFLKAEAAYKKINEELLVLNKQYEQVFEKIVKLES